MKDGSILANLITGVVSFVIAYLVFRKNSKGYQLKYVTKERKEWRDKMRNLMKEFLSIPLNRDGNMIHDVDIKRLQEIRTEVEIRLNPNDIEDKKIVKCIDGIIDDLKKGKTEKFDENSKNLSELFAHLLKHDWERVKKETELKAKVKILDVLFIGFLAYKFVCLYYSYSLLNFFCYCPCTILCVISELIIATIIYLFLKKLCSMIFYEMEKSFYKSNFISKCLNLTIRTKV